ncbi:MAG: TIGR04086 family membrane protein [Oscillospiraceae bacterium]
MHKSTRAFKGRLPVIADTVLSSLLGFVVIFLCVLFFAFIVTKIDATDKVINVLSGIALCVGAYAGGYISAKKRRKNGLLMGILCGLFMFLIILVAGSFFVKTTSGFSPSIKLILTLVCGAIGGIVGVNSKRNRF